MGTKKKKAVSKVRTRRRLVLGIDFDAWAYRSDIDGFYCYAQSSPPTSLEQVGNPEKFDKGKWVPVRFVEVYE